MSSAAETAGEDVFSAVWGLKQVGLDIKIMLSIFPVPTHKNLDNCVQCVSAPWRARSLCSQSSTRGRSWVGVSLRNHRAVAPQNGGTGIVWHRYQTATMHEEGKRNMCHCCSLNVYFAVRPTECDNVYHNSYIRSNVCVCRSVCS